jgi:hypothetical protein
MVILGPSCVGQAIPIHRGLQIKSTLDHTTCLSIICRLDGGALEVIKGAIPREQ